MSKEMSKEMIADLVEKEDKRKYYQEITRKARIKRDEVNGELWKEAFLDLAKAADRVDAMIARTEKREVLFLVEEKEK